LPEIVRTPGYPLLVSIGALAGSTEPVTVALQIAISCLTVWFVYRLGLLVLPGAEWARAAALAYAVEPLSILYCSKFLSETLFTCLVTAGAYSLAVYLKERSWRPLLTAAVLLSAGALVRPIGYYLPLVIAVALVVAASVRWKPRLPALAQCAALLIVAAAPIVAWQVRNSVVAGYDRFSAIEDINLYFYNAAALVAHGEGVPLGEIQARWGYSDRSVFDERHPWLRGKPAAERYAAMRREALAILRPNIAAYARIHLAGVPSIALGTGLTEYATLLGIETDASENAARWGDNYWQRFWAMLGERPVYLGGTAMLLCAVLAYWALALRAAVSWTFAGRLDVLMLAGVALYFMLVAAGPTSTHRMRHPAMPAMAILAAQGLYLLSARKRVTGPHPVRTPVGVGTCRPTARRETEHVRSGL
jgi:4-amino-4-deoxy-L-arabinose transferase-like glycosyltransferase